MRGAIKGESKAACDKAIGIGDVPRGSGMWVHAGAAQLADNHCVGCGFGTFSRRQ